ncbi:MAG: diguanylate cyclase [Candidatus Omnitrophica bacterium]|nr:diguanylate cyclase [Candidatus Omnitrophota bacterium]
MKNITAEIIRLCLLLERMGENHYIELVTRANAHEEKELWSELANDENKHIHYWEFLIEKSEHGALPDLFENPYLIKHELEALVLRLNEVKQYYANKRDLKNALFLSLHIEYYMLHHAFRVLLDYIASATGDNTAKDEYDHHLNKILDAPQLLGIDSPDINLLTETIRHFWNENKTLSMQVLIDPLTGLFNRRGFFKTLFPLLHLAKRENRSVGVLMIDIDNFKYINDRYGHPTGDKVLHFFADTIKSNVRASDITGRFGGEEFIIFLPEVDVTHIFSLAERIRTTIQEKTKEDIPITISIGVAHGFIESDAESELHVLINNADRSLRNAKSGGKNRVMVSA